jgi:hypothetical protein
MPGIIGWATLRGIKHTNLVQLDLPILTVRGVAPKFSKRTILAGLVYFHVVFDFLATSQPKIVKWLAAGPVWFSEKPCGGTFRG